MSKNNKKNQEKYTTEEVLHTLDETAIQSEKFLEKYAKVIGIGFGVILLVAFGYFAYLKFIIEPKNDEAFNDFSIAQNAFLKDSLDQALGGKGGINGFEDIIKNYSGTDAEKLSHYYAGIIKFEKGKYQEALDHFKDFSDKDDILTAINNGAIGDCLVQLGKDDEALKQFEKSAENTENYFIAYTFYKKAGMLAIHKGDNKSAFNYFNKVKERFPEESEDLPELEAYLELLSYKNK